ncbi:hypothetical protein [Streptomyces bicolor]|nr:hypothetical protein [Streptomyces bicolor]
MAISLFLVWGEAVGDNTAARLRIPLGIPRAYPCGHAAHHPQD